VDDRLLWQLWIAVRIEIPNITKRGFAQIAQANYYPAPVAINSIVRHLNRLIAAKKREETERE
jgi:hypothetical protein